MLFLSFIALCLFRTKEFSNYFINNNIKIILNKIKCKKCGDEIESCSVHDFKFCKCGAVAVDGGVEYLKRSGNREEWEELSQVIEESEY